MKLDEAIKFYESDQKLYDVVNNSEFLRVFSEEEMDKLYSLAEMQQIIDFICSWYEDKYTERDLEYIERYGMPDIKSMKKNLVDRTVDNLFEVLPDKIAFFLLIDKSKTRINLLNLVTLKILYSKNTSPNRGFERARIFITEFNNSISDINLNTKELEASLPVDFERIKIADEVVLEDFIKLPVKEAEELIRASYHSEFKEPKVKQICKRIFKRNK